MSTDTLSRAGMFAWEGPGDLPFYRGEPTGYSAAQWWMLCVLVALGYGLLLLPWPLFDTMAGQFLPPLLFLGIPLAGLRQLSREHWLALMRPVDGYALRWTLSFALLTLVIAFVLALLASLLGDVTESPAALQLTVLDVPARLLFLLRTLPQLLGEEFMTLLPLLGLLHWLHVRRHMPRRRALLLAWITTSLGFGLAHLPVYQWNLVQCLVVLGGVRAVLTLAYLKTRNAWVAFGAHVLADWAVFTYTLLELN